MTYRQDSTKASMTEGLPIRRPPCRASMSPTYTKLRT